MLQEVIRCPYCVLGSEFRPMLRRSKKTFLCLTCGHTSSADDPHSKCSCNRCRKMNRVANQLSRDRGAQAASIG